LNFIIRHRGNILQIEALLFGQSGLLGEGLLFDEYFNKLQNEYMHLKKKYKLKPLNPGIWKFMRIRPVNFPTIRIAQFASLLNSIYPLFSNIIKCTEPENIYSLLGIKTSPYWEDHYNFAKKSTLKNKNLGKDALHIININTIIPFLFVYGQAIGNTKLKETAIEWLEKLPPENNNIIRNWESLGIKPLSSLHTQGMLQLTNNYCTKRKCLQCSIGVKIISCKNI